MPSSDKKFVSVHKKFIYAKSLQLVHSPIYFSTIIVYYNSVTGLLVFLLEDQLVKPEPLEYPDILKKKGKINVKMLANSTR